MKTKRYFYTCPIKALYMMKEFGVKFEQEVFIGGFGDSELVKTSFEEVCRELADWQQQFKDQNRFYVCKESEAIFDPKREDVGWHEREGDYVFEGKLWLSGSLRSNKSKDYEGIKIILRDNKQFFTPEVEE